MTITLQFKWAAWSKDLADWETPEHRAARAEMESLRPNQELYLETHSLKNLTTSEITIRRNEAPTTEYEVFGNFHIEWDDVYDISCTLASDFDRDDLADDHTFLDWLDAKLPSPENDNATGTTHHFHCKANTLAALIQGIDASKDTALELDKKAWNDLQAAAHNWASEHPPQAAT